MRIVVMRGRYPPRLGYSSRSFTIVADGYLCHAIETASRGLQNHLAPGSFETDGPSEELDIARLACAPDGFISPASLT
ncbi:hypothetical protein DYI37_01795 [Fulvimarina endophytica]|uniref:Uncharacterized protein n=1 Tax=Fulvimarina endophytica TaxID=2293836 RepID=A0A371XAH3_9HYPH|nr:hypothetical protein DYI37_01795 [Fulvimarina endophytica]